MADKPFLQQMEEAMVAKIKEKNIDLAVKPCPEDPNQYQLLSAKGAILVHYDKSELSEPIQPPLILQHETMYFNVIIRLKNLRDNEGAYDLIEKVKAALSGWQFGDLTEKMYAKTVELAQVENGVWSYVIQFKVKAKFVEEKYSY